MSYACPTTVWGADTFSLSFTGVQIKTYTQGAILKEMYPRRLLSEPKAGLDDEILNFRLTPIMEWDFGSLGKE